jgi:restriction system protein
MAVKLKMARNSIFAILLRSRWWLSWLIAAALALVGRALLPGELGPLAAFPAIPFVIVGSIAAWKQLRQPGPARVQATVDAVSAMSWPAFAAALEEALRQDGQQVTRLQGAAADFEVTRAGRVTLVSARRWKAARVGAEPLRALRAAMAERGAAAGLCVALGAPSDAAIAFARDHGIEFLNGDGLALLMRRQRLHIAPGAVPRP